MITIQANSGHLSITLVVSPAVLPDRKLVTWRELCRIEPSLLDVERFVLSLRGRRDWRQWEQAKARFSCLVGWHARKPQLKSSRYYDICYRHLLGIFETRRRRAAR